MIEMNVNIFFRESEILRFMDAKTARAMSRALSHIWRRAQTSMRYRRRPSSPGSPPSAHIEKGAKLRKLMAFAFNPREKIGVVGPLAFAKVEAPKLNEFGGNVLRRSHGRIQSATYPKRPFMLPALMAELPTLPSEWSGRVER